MKKITGILLALFILMGCQGEKSAETLQIAVIPKGTTHEFWKSIHAGAIKAADELGVEIIWQGPQKEDDRQMQIQVVQNFISRGIDAMVLAPLDVKSLAPPVEAASKRDIPVVIIDSDLDSEAHKSFIATNNYEGGKMCARRLADVMGKKGKIFILRNMEGSASTINREEGFLAEIKTYAPEIEILSDNQFAGATLEQALQASQNLLNRFPEVEGIFASNESTLKGTLRALQTAGKAGKVKLVGFDASEILVNGLKANEIDGLAVQDPFNMGYLGVKTAVATLKNEPYEAKIDTQIMMITPENFETSEAQTLLFPDLKQWLGE